MTDANSLRIIVGLLLLSANFGMFTYRAVARDGELVVSIVDQETAEQVPARMTLRDAQGRSPKIPQTIPDGVGFAIAGPLPFRPREGQYQFEIIRGPEYRVIHGGFVLGRDGVGHEEIKLPRFVGMLAEGWVSADVFAPRTGKDLPLLMRANDLRAAVTTDRASQPKEVPSGHSIRQDGWFDARAPGLLAIGAPPLDVLKPTEFSATFIQRAVEKQAEAIVALNPSDWDLPFWLATEKLSALAVLHPEVRLDRPGKILGRQPSETGYLDAMAPGRWADRVWRYALEAGFKLPAVGASGAAAQGNPVGYNRAYVYCEEAPESATIWKHLWQGRSIVTNGPLMRPRLGDYLPGATIYLESGQQMELAPEMKLAVRDPVDYLEVIYNDRVIYSARLDELAKKGLTTPLLTFDKSGWVVMRVVTSHEDHWRMAVSNPWWIDVAGEPRISKKACEFFISWLQERTANLAKQDAETIASATPFVQQARIFWKQRAEMANVD